MWRPQRNVLSFKSTVAVKKKNLLMLLNTHTQQLSSLLIATNSSHKNLTRDVFKIHVMHEMHCKTVLFSSLSVLSKMQQVVFRKVGCFAAIERDWLVEPTNQRRVLKR